MVVVFSTENTTPWWFLAENGVHLEANMSSLLLSDLELARLESPPGTPDTQLVVQLAQRMLDELAMAPPISHDVAASLRDVIRIEEAAMPWAGYLARAPDGLVITLRSSDGWRRKRFTVFHEIEHTFLPGFGVQVHYRCDPTAPLNTTPARNPTIEALCDIGAAELLFPRAPFCDDLAGNAITFDLVEQIADRYDASLEATARRVVSLHSQGALLIVLEPACRPTAPRELPLLRVRSIQASGGWPYVPRHKSVPDDGVFGRALQGEVVDEIASLGNLTNPQIAQAYVSARRYPYLNDQGEQHMRVLALITPATSSLVNYGN